MAARVLECEELLQDLSGRLGEADQFLIRRTLEQVRCGSLLQTIANPSRNQEQTSGREDSSTPGSFRRSRTSGEPEPQSFHTEHQATGCAGSTESLDRIDEDFNRSDVSRRTGFMGKNSEVAWMEKLRRHTDVRLDKGEENDPRTDFGTGLDESREDSGRKVQRNQPLSESNYHCDDIPLSTHENVLPYHVPPRATADLLLTCYLDCVHPALPILGKTTFLRQYNAFYDSPNLKTGPQWLAILNLVFAIGARYSRLVRAEWRTITDDHETYFSRARLLGLDASVIWAPAELQRIQSHGLTSFYLMATHQINR